MAMLVYGPIEVFVFAFDPDVGLVHSIALRSRLEVWPATLLQLRAVSLDPPPDAAGIDGQASFAHQFGDMRISEWEAEVITDAAEDHRAGIVAPLERVR